MNILLINHYAGSVHHGMEFRPYYLAREWALTGHHVTIVAADYSHLRSVNPKCESAVQEEEIDGIRYVWLKTPPYVGNGVKRVINIAAFLGQLMRHRRQVFGAHVPDAIIASSTYPLDVYFAGKLADQVGAKLIYEVHDLWPLTLIEVGGMPRNHPFIQLLQWGEDYAYRRADRVVSILPCAAEYMQQRGMALHKYHVIPNGVDLSEWETTARIPEEYLTAIERIRSEKGFLIGYAGGHGLANALDNLLSAAALLQDTPVGFVLVGKGPSKSELKEQAAKLGLRNILFLDPVKKAQIPDFLSLMDALFLGWKPEPIYRYGISPNKIMDYMMAGKPIIHAVDAGNDPVAEADCGLSVPPNDPKALAEAIQRLSSYSPSQLEAMGERGRSYVRTNHDYRVLADSFLSLMQSVSSQKPAPELAGQAKR